MAAPTFVIRILAAGLKTNGRTLTNDDWNKFLNDYVPEQKLVAYKAIKPMLERGGFIFDSSLWKWQTARKNMSAELWVTITFEDSYNEGKKVFMQYIYNTGILKFDHTVIKSYG